MIAACHGDPSVLSQLAGIGVGLIAFVVILALILWGISGWETGH